MFKIAQESSTEALKSSENDLKIKHVNVQRNVSKSAGTVDSLGSEGKVGAQICIGKALGIRF